MPYSVGSSPTRRTTKSLIDQLECSCHKVITTAKDEQTGRIHTLLAVQMTEDALADLIEILKRCEAAGVAAGLSRRAEMGSKPMQRANTRV